MKLLLPFFLITLFFQVNAQQSADLDSVLGALLGETPIEEDLQQLCDEIGGRVTGSDANAQAVEWGMRKFQEAGVKVWKDAFQMPVLWLEKSATAKVFGDMTFEPNIVAKYQSPPGEYTGQLISIGMGTETEIEQVKDQIKGNFVLVEMDLCFDINGLFAEYAAATKIELAAEKYAPPRNYLYGLTSSWAIVPFYHFKSDG